MRDAVQAATVAVIHQNTEISRFLFWQLDWMWQRFLPFASNQISNPHFKFSSVLRLKAPHDS